jgi:two-component system sensor histidine kinase AlgZ
MTAGFLIPDLCSARSVLFLSLISVLLALTLVLFAGAADAFDWVALGRSSVFILWNMLASAALLCLLRRAIARWPLPVGAAASYALLLLVCLVSSLGAQWVFGALETGGPFRPDAAWLGRDLGICALLGGAALRYFHLQGEIIARERAALDARIQSLQARIRPHFLFNSMNIIASLIAVAPEQAERAVEDLAELFRASLREGEVTVPLATELDLCERYMRLEQWRLGARLRFTREVDDTLGERLPPLSVQPLLENAVYHGIQPRPEGGEVTLRIGRDGARLRIEVLNPLPERPDSPGSGMALANIRARLAAIYGDRAALELQREDGTFRARLWVPLEAHA